MKRKLLTTIALLALCVATIAATVNSGRAQRSEFETPFTQPAPKQFKPLAPRLTNPSPPTLSPASKSPASKSPVSKKNASKKTPSKNLLSQAPPVPTDPLACAIQPSRSRVGSNQANSNRPLGPLPLERFRQPVPLASAGKAQVASRAVQPYQPREAIVPIDPTNFGDRFLKDIDGRIVRNEPLIVLHETVGSLYSVLNFFRTPHPRDADQSSYHTLIALDGTVVYVVPPDKRAFGAGNSSFPGAAGTEAVKTHPSFPASVNNFAYHISLETPPDGINNSPRHSGYTAAQYQSLAWLVAKTGVADSRITTHQAIDRSGQRMDPRSFSFSRFFQLLQTYTKNQEIPIRCTLPPELQAKVLKS
jgi:hypothetical protein